MDFSVVILSANAKNLVQCVAKLRQCEPELWPERIVVVDDGARSQAEPQVGALHWVAGTKPFVFARNANLGIRACEGDVILLNDDALLTTPGGFSAWQRVMQNKPEVGLCSAAVQGVVGNPRQQAAGRRGLIAESGDIAFVCVFIPRRVFESVGALDERFTGYGFEDNDYCERVRARGLSIAVWHDCIVNHDGRLESSFRSRSDIQQLFQQNQRAFHEKRSNPERGELATTAPEPAVVDLMYLAWNRLEFTRETFSALLDNTNWKRVRQLFVYDDGSQDGTREWLEARVDRVPAAHCLVCTSFGSPVLAMLDFIQKSTAPILAKLDNDAMVPPAWLDESLGVLERNPELSLLGIEAMCEVEVSPSAARGYASAQFISGLGLYRRNAFARTRPRAFQKYFGLEEWQVAQGANLTRGWIRPALPVFLLDRMPLEPWRGLSAAYVQRGWQRSWPAYPPASALWHWHWPDGATAEPHTAAAGSSRVEEREDTQQLRLNLHWGDDMVSGCENASFGPWTGDACVDLTGEWPWTEGSFHYIRAHNVLERLNDKIHTMNELWRVLHDGGLVDIVIPSTDGTGAFQDPSQRSFWNRRSFFYYEDDNPYRERHAARYGISARFQVVGENCELTLDGPILQITLRAVKGASPHRSPPSNERSSAATPIATLAGATARQPITALSSRIAYACAMRVKNETAHIREAIASVLPLCERVFVFDDHSTDDTVGIAQSFGNRCVVLRSPFEGLDEARDKNYVLELLVAVAPDWVLWIDGDEVLERRGPAALRAAAASHQVSNYSLRVAFLWDHPMRVRIDGVYGRFDRPSFFRLRGQDASRLTFRATGNGGNFHCGNVPTGLSGASRSLSLRLKHYGYLLADQRRRKFEWYTTTDPNNAAEDNYRHIIGAPGARYAPGPPRFAPWRE